MNVINLDIWELIALVSRKEWKNLIGKPSKIRKQREAYITWEDNDMDSSGDSENEVVNLSLMAKNYESEEEVTSSNNNLSISFDEL